MHRNLQTDLDIILKILHNCKQNFQYSQYLHNPQTSEEDKYISYSRVFKFLRHSLWRLVVIELCKIINKSKSDFFNIWNLLENINASNIYSINNIPHVKILEWYRSLSSQTKTIKKIKFLRHKVYAHTDPDVDVRTTDISFKQIENLISTIEAVIKDLYQIIFQKDLIILETIFEEEPFNIIKDLVREEKSRPERVYILGKAAVPK